MRHRSYKPNVTFDREQIRNRADARIYDFKEARRIRRSQHLYDVLILEMLEEGCIYGASYFMELVAKETRLIEIQYITKRVREDPEFLFELSENIKRADLFGMQDTVPGHLNQLNVLYKSALIIESKRETYSWLILDYYNLIFDVMSKINLNEVAYNEIRTRILYKYASYLFAEGERLQLVIEVLSNAINICVGNTWKPDTEPEMSKFGTMHEAVAQKLAMTMLVYGKQFIYTNPERSVQLAQNAIWVLAQVGLEKNKMLVCEASIDYITFVIECQKFDLALKQIANVESITANDSRLEFIPVKCKVLFLKAVCVYNLNQYKMALPILRTVLVDSRNYELTDLEGRILLQMGRVHRMHNESLTQAREAFTLARQMFEKRNDYNSKTVAEYMLASLKAQEIFPELLKIMSSTDYCSFYQLRQWKNACKKFFTDDYSFSTSSSSSEHDSATEEQECALPQVSQIFLKCMKSGITLRSKASIFVHTAPTVRSEPIEDFVSAVLPNSESIEKENDYVCLLNEFTNTPIRRIKLKNTSSHKLKHCGSNITINS